VESLDDLADEIAGLERRVSDAIFDMVRAQLRNDDAENAKELERNLSRVRRSLQKAEHLLRRSDDENDD
jgi:Mg2+ and Co2+ transporter CorA